MSDLELYKFEELIEKVNNLEQAIIGAYVFVALVVIGILAFALLDLFKKDK